MSLRVTPGFLWTVGTILPVVCTIVIGLRFTVRRAQHAKIGWDDWLLVPALVCHTSGEIDIYTYQGSKGPDMGKWQQL